MSVSDARTWRRVVVVTLFSGLSWMLDAGCVPHGACLRNTDCPDGQSCSDGACAFPPPPPSDATTVPPVPTVPPVTVVPDAGVGIIPVDASNG